MSTILRILRVPYLYILKHFSVLAMPSSTLIAVSPSYKEPQYPLDIKDLPLAHQLLLQSLESLEFWDADYQDFPCAGAFNWPRMIARLHTLVKKSKVRWTKMRLHIFVFSSENTTIMDRDRLWELDRGAFTEAVKGGGELYKYLSGEPGSCGNNVFMCTISFPQRFAISTELLRCLGFPTQSHGSDWGLSTPSGHQGRQYISRLPARAPYFIHRRWCLWLFFGTLAGKPRYTIVGQLVFDPGKGSVGMEVAAKVSYVSDTYVIDFSSQDIHGWRILNL